MTARTSSARRRSPGLSPVTGAALRQSRLARWIAVNSRVLIGVAGLVAVACAWELSAGLHIVDPFYTSSPSRIVQAEISYFGDGDGLRDLAVTAQAFSIGMLLSIGIGVPLGLAIGYYRFVNVTVEPIINLMYQTPYVALAPIAILWFGIGISAQTALAFAASLSPIVIATSSGPPLVEKSLMRVARVYRASDFQIFRTLILPASIPAIVSGLRLGCGLALVGAISVEMIVSENGGIGNTIVNAGTAQDASLMFAAIGVAALFGLIVSVGLRLVGQRIDQWRVV